MCRAHGVHRKPLLSLIDVSLWSNIECVHRFPPARSGGLGSSRSQKMREKRICQNTLEYVFGKEHLDSNRGNFIRKIKICDANLSNQVNTPQHDAVQTQESSTFHPTNQKTARNIEPWQRKRIVHMIRSEKSLITSQICEAEGLRVYS